MGEWTLKCFAWVACCEMQLAIWFKISCCISGFPKRYNFHSVSSVIRYVGQQSWVVEEFQFLLSSQKSSTSHLTPFIRFLFKNVNYPWAFLLWGACSFTPECPDLPPRCLDPVVVFIHVQFPKHIPCFPKEAHFGMSVHGTACDVGYLIISLWGLTWWGCDR